jgi:hypothetical protein
VLSAVAVPINTMTDHPIRQDTSRPGASTRPEADRVHQGEAHRPRQSPQGRFVWYNPSVHRTTLGALSHRTTLESNGDPRFTIDYRPLNKVTVKADMSGLPDAESVIDRMMGFEKLHHARRCGLVLPAAHPQRRHPQRTGLLAPWGIPTSACWGQGQTNSSVYAQAFTEQVAAALPASLAPAERRRGRRLTAGRRRHRRQQGAGREQRRQRREDGDAVGDAAASASVTNLAGLWTTRDWQD